MNTPNDTKLSVLPVVINWNKPVPHNTKKIDPIIAIIGRIYLSQILQSLKLIII